MALPSFLTERMKANISEDNEKLTIKIDNPHITETCMLFRMNGYTQFYDENKDYIAFIKLVAPKEKPIKLIHVSPIKNKEKILKEGLLAHIPEKGWKVKGVYFHNGRRDMASLVGVADRAGTKGDFAVFMMKKVPENLFYDPQEYNSKDCFLVENDIPPEDFDFVGIFDRSKT